jgi:FtsP/CotA-like multicopper oxidase with cupredoxin domain
MRTFFSRVFFLCLWINTICYLPTISAKTCQVNLSIDYKIVEFDHHKKIQAIAVNNQIPGPILRFKEGDHVIIVVHNHLDEGTTIHWHGLLVPWQMDGVEGVSQTPIPPGASYRYEFTLKQAGTYWYHAHKGLQEQSGLYGAFIVDPKKPTSIKYDKDYTIVLSDWINTPPDQVLANLKKNGDYYSLKFPLQTSLVDFLKSYRSASHNNKNKIFDQYLKMQKSRMGLYDISDIAYNVFLMNGRTKTNPWKGNVSLGDRVRLRFIGAGASTIFNVKTVGADMTLIQADGSNVRPHRIKSFSIAPGETYDVLLNVKTRTPKIIYAESIDKIGAVVGALVLKENEPVHFNQVQPFKDPSPVTMQHKPTPAQQSITKYDSLIANRKTNNPHKPFHIIKMSLTGYMDQYIWSINGVTGSRAKPIMIVPGERYRLILANHTIMHHPMHLHGHWMILRNGHGAYDPLLHTIDVPPNSTIVADFDADASGQWIFHCHNLYHLSAGMYRVFRYKNVGYKQEKPYKYLYPNLETLRAATILDVNRNLRTNNDYEISLLSLIGKDYNRFQVQVKEAEIDDGVVTNQGDVDLFYWRLISQFWAVKGGANIVFNAGASPYIQPGIGLEGTMPFFIDTDLRIYLHKGSFKLDLELNRAIHIYRSFFIDFGFRSIWATKKVAENNIGSGLNESFIEIQPTYVITPWLSLYLQYEYDQYFGDLKRILRSQGSDTSDHAINLGLILSF